MALDFPTSPALNEIYTYGGRSWQWNGTAWDVYSSVSGNVVTQLNGLTGGVTLTAGSNITLTPVGNTITITSAGGSGGSGITGPYVISIRGLSGSVGLTNGSGIGLSVSGNTLTISNTGVLSFNGLTGSVTGLTTGSVGGTYGSIQYKSAQGLCGSPYFTIRSDPNYVFNNTLLTFIGPTGEDGIAVNAQQGLEFSRVSNLLGLDEGGGAGIYSKGYDPTNSGIANLFIGAPDGIDYDLNSNVYFGFIDPNTNSWTTYATLSRNPTGDPIFSTYNGCVFVAEDGFQSSSGIFGGNVTVAGNITAPNIVNSFNGLTGSVVGVRTINGLTGGVTFAAGTNISLTPIGNTVTVATSGLSPVYGITASIDFSENINGLEIVIYGTGVDYATSLRNIENSIIQYILLEANTLGTHYCVFESIKSFYDATNGWSARLIVKPQFVDYTNPNIIRTAEELLTAGIISVTINYSSSGGVNAEDFWTSVDSVILYHQEETYVTKTITGITWVTDNMFLTCKILGLTSGDHTPEDAIVEGVNFEINNILAGIGFDIIGHAPEGTYGKYTIKCLGQ